MKRHIKGYEEDIRFYHNAQLNEAKGEGGAAASRDSDRDGYSDIDEIIAGTDPNDPNDYPSVPVATPTPSPTPSLPPTPTPTATATVPPPTPPGFEAVFANFFAPQKPLLKMQVSLAKLFFLRKGLCLDAEGTRNRKSSKGKNKKYKKGWVGLFFYFPFLFIF